MSSNRTMAAALLVAVASAACASTSDGGALPFEVTDEERGRALDLLREQDAFRSLDAGGVTYLVDIQVLRDKEREGERELLIAHYRTKDDLAILSRVNLTRDEVVSVESRPHMALPLSPEEFELARELALADDRVRRLVRGRDVVVESQLSRTSDPDDPLFGHRLVNILLHGPEGYLEVRTLLVDLTTGQVTVELEDEE